MRLSDFDFDLPESFIAQNPANPRDHSKLMLLNRSDHSISHNHFYDLESLLGKGDVLVLNNSRVIPARLRFENKEIFLLAVPDSKGMAECMVRPGKVFTEGKVFRISGNLFVRVIKISKSGTRLLQFLDANKNPMDKSVLDDYGAMPLPPYIKRSSADFSDYQTVYAAEDGSVAAPTAGLHFTSDLLEKLKSRGVEIVEVLLHVGLGTFLPVKTENIEDHIMHEEFFSLSEGAAAILNGAKLARKRIIAVGTTSVRVLESTFNDGSFLPQLGKTDIFIYPGYEWKAVDALISNFHLPKSTLLMLVSSFAGRDFIMKAYSEAKKHEYRFFSFGDAMLIV